MEDFRPNDSEHAIRSNQTHSAFQRYYTTRLMQQLLSSKQDSKYYEFVDFDITSVTTPEQIAELDKKLAEIVQSPEIQSELERLEGDKDFEKAFYGKLREEVAIEIKKDSDRIENAHKVFVALETGNLDEILQDPETQKWSEEVYSADKEKRKEAFKSYIHDILTSDDPKLDEMCWIKTIENMDDNSLSGKSGYPDLDKPITTRMAILSRLTGKPYEIQRKGSYGPMHAYYSHYENQIISSEDMIPEQKQQAELARSELESPKGQNAKYQKGKVFISGYAVGDDKDIREIATSGVEKGEIFSVEIDISRDELLARGINPDEIGWKSLEQIKEEQLQIEKEAKVSPKDIADADREQALTTTEIGGFKGFIKKLLDKFKGKGEK